MKKHAVLIAAALLLSGCSAQAAAPAEPSSAASTPAPAAASEAAPAAAPTPAEASAPRMTTAETCAVLNNFYDPDSMPGGGTPAERDALQTTMKDLPGQASEDLKEAATAISAFADIALTDARNDTRELDKYMADPATANSYAKSVEFARGTCGLGTKK